MDNPVLLAGDLAAEFVTGLFLFVQQLVAPVLETVEAAVEMAGDAAVHPHRAGRQVGEEPPVMADQDDGRRHGAQFGFEPFDGRQVEMVGRLVEQQDVGFGGQGAGEGGASRLAAREVCGVAFRGEAQLLDQITGAVNIIARRKPGQHIGFDGFICRQVRLLRQVAQRGAGLQKALALVRLDHAGRDLEQGRFARTVAADKRDAVGGVDLQAGIAEQRRSAESQRDIGQKKPGRLQWITRSDDGNDVAGTPFLPNPGGERNHIGTCGLRPAIAGLPQRGLLSVGRRDKLPIRPSNGWTNGGLGA